MDLSIGEKVAVLYAYLAESSVQSAGAFLAKLGEALEVHGAGPAVLDTHVEAAYNSLDSALTLDAISDVLVSSPDPPYKLSQLVPVQRRTLGHFAMCPKCCVWCVILQDVPVLIREEHCILRIPCSVIDNSFFDLFRPQAAMRIPVVRIDFRQDPSELLWP